MLHTLCSLSNKGKQITNPALFGSMHPLLRCIMIEMALRNVAARRGGSKAQSVCAGLDDSVGKPAPILFIGRSTRFASLVRDNIVTPRQHELAPDIRLWPSTDDGAKGVLIHDRGSGGQWLCQHRHAWAYGGSPIWAGISAVPTEASFGFSPWLYGQPNSEALDADGRGRSAKIVNFGQPTKSRARLRDIFPRPSEGLHHSQQFLFQRLHAAYDRQHGREELRNERRQLAGLVRPGIAEIEDILVPDREPVGKEV